MKKLLLLVVLVASYGYATDIPSLSELKKEYIKEYGSDSSDVFFLQSFLQMSINRFLDNDAVTLSPSSIRDVLTRWYNEDKDLFHATTPLIDGKPPINIVDSDLIRAKTALLLTQKGDPSGKGFWGRLQRRQSQIAEILQSLGIKPTLSDQQLDEIAQERFRVLEGTEG